jgi:glycosyltransferase involved in cell wall biosynthesis
MAAATREICSIVIYPDTTSGSAPADQLSALAEYSHTLLGSLPAAERERHRILTSVKSQSGHGYHDRGLEVLELWTKGRLDFAAQILRYLRRHPEVKVVHLQHEFNQFGKTLTIPLIPAMMLAIRWVLRRRCVVTLHEVLGPAVLKTELLEKLCINFPAGLARVLMFFYYRLICAASHVVFVQHEDFRDVLIKEYRIKADIRLLPLGTLQQPLVFPREESRQKLGYTADHRVLLFFGTIDWRKGLDVLMDAFAQLPAGYRLIIAGGQPVRIKDTPTYREWYNKLSARMASHPGIQTFGFIPDEDIARLFSAADMVVLPYVIPQRVSAVLNQAASYELPFIGSEAFAGHADPLALCKATAEDLAAKIAWSFDGHLEDLRNYARFYKKEHAWERSAEILAATYAELMQDRPNQA